MRWSFQLPGSPAAGPAPRAGQGNPVRFREAQFLIWCARVAPSEPIRRRIVDGAQAGLNWPLLLELAKSHGVEALLARTLTGLCAEVVPQAELEALRRRREEAGAVNRSGAEELVRLCHAFDDAGVPALPFRGVALAAMALGDLTLCAPAAPAVLVRESQLAAAQQVLLSQGYAPRGGDPDHSGGARASDQPLVYTHPRTLLQVELRWGVRHRRLLYRIDRPEVWGHARPFSLDGRRVKGMAPEEALLVLCAHGTHQAWGQLCLVTEVAELIRAGRLNWKRVLSTALEWKCYRVLLLGLALAHRVMETPIPPPILHAIAADADVLQMASRMPASLLLQQQEGLGDREVPALLLTLQDDWNGRWRYGMALCRSDDPVIHVSPEWFRWRRPLLWLFHAMRPVYSLSRWLSPPASIRQLFHR